MATQVASIAAAPMVGGRRRKICCLASWTLAATTGVATAVDTDDPGITMSRSAAGTYALVFPATPGKVHINGVIMNSGASAAGMVADARLSAILPSAGTATIQIVGGNSGVAIDPLAADVVTLFVELVLDIS